MLLLPHTAHLHGVTDASLSWTKMPLNLSQLAENSEAKAKLYVQSTFQLLPTCALRYSHGDFPTRCPSTTEDGRADFTRLFWEAVMPESCDTHFEMIDVGRWNRHESCLKLATANYFLLHRVRLLYVRHATCCRFIVCCPDDGPRQPRFDDENLPWHDERALRYQHNNIKETDAGRQHCHAVVSIIYATSVCTRTINSC